MSASRLGLCSEGRALCKDKGLPGAAGFKPGDWATPPGPPAPEMAGFTPVRYNTSSAVDSAGGFTGSAGNRAGAYTAKGDPHMTIDGILNAPPPPSPGIFGAGQ